MHEVIAGLAELREIGITDWFACDRGRGCRRPRPVRTRRWSCCGESVTVRSVPIPESGSSVFFCARSSPCDRLAIEITSATPRPSPSSVTIVRARRRTSSFRR